MPGDTEAMENICHEWVAFSRQQTEGALLLLHGRLRLALLLQPFRQIKQLLHLLQQVGPLGREKLSRR